MADTALLIERLRRPLNARALDTRSFVLDADRANEICIQRREAASVLGAQAEEIAALRVALTTIQAWDCLNPPRGDLLADLPWLRRVVDAALAASDQERKG